MQFIQKWVQEFYRLSISAARPEIVPYENLEDDAYVAKKLSAMAHYIYTCIKISLDQQSHIYKGELLFR